MSRAHLSTAAEVKITDFGLSKNMQLGGTDVKNIQELCKEKTSAQDIPGGKTCLGSWKHLKFLVAFINLVPEAQKLLHIVDR